MFPELSTKPLPELILLLGGLIALVIGFVGKSKKTHIDEVALVLGFVVGAFMIFMAVVLMSNGGWPGSTVLVLALLGFGLFFRVFKKVKLSGIIAVIVGILVGYLLYSMHASFLSNEAVLVIAFVVMVIVYVILKFAETLVRIGGYILSFRPILIILGLVALLEAALLFSNSSLSAIFG